MSKQSQDKNINTETKDKGKVPGVPVANTGNFTLKISPKVLIIVFALIVAVAANLRYFNIGGSSGQNSGDAANQNTSTQEAGGSSGTDRQTEACFGYEDGAIVGFLGPKGTFSHEAATVVPGDKAEFLEKESVEDVLADLDGGRCDYAVVPVENTIGGLTGADSPYLDLLLDRRDVHVVAEVNLPIRQTLIGMSGAELKDIKRVYSHPQGLTQGAEWLAENLPGVETVEVDSTAEGVRMVSELQDKSCAAIAAPGAAAVFGLDILAENIQLITSNVTRFYVVTEGAADTTTADGGSSEDAAEANDNNDVTDAAKANISMAAGDRAVIVASCVAECIPDMMSQLDKLGCSLVSIHERPTKTILGEYQYCIEVENVSGKEISEEALLEAVGETVSGTKAAGPEVRVMGMFSTVNP